MPEPTQATIDALNITTQVVEAVIDPDFDAQALFKRLDGYWNTETEKEGYTLRWFICFHNNVHNNGKPSIYRGIWEAEGSDTGELIGGRSTGEYTAELAFLFPVLTEEGELPAHPELTAVVSIDFGGIDSGGEIIMKLNNYSALGNGAWHTYTYGGKTMAEAEAQAFAVREKADKSGSYPNAEEIFKLVVDWLETTGCLHLIPPDYIAEYTLLRVRWMEAEARTDMVGLGAHSRQRQPGQSAGHAGVRQQQH